MIAIVDYGVGNLFSLQSSLKMIGAEAVVSGDAAVIAAADRIILPGVGAFGDAAAKLRASGMDKAVIREARIFERKLKLTRTITVSKKENTLTLRDCVENEGDAPSPLMVLYHMNMGYPLLSEDAEIYIPAQTVTPRNEHSAKDLDTWNKVLTPQPGFVEQCYFHDFAGTEGKAGIYNPAIGKGLFMEFDTASYALSTRIRVGAIGSAGLNSLFIITTLA